jgi:hypothetical protein
VASALGLANRKLYHASILLRLLDRELARADLPAAVLKEALGEAARLHLQASYAWFLVELVAPAELPPDPPRCVDLLIERYALEEPLRGELVELRRMEAAGWLGDLLAPAEAPAAASVGGFGELTVVNEDRDIGQLGVWHRDLEELMDRMSHGLEEW